MLPTHPNFYQRPFSDSVFTHVLHVKKFCKPIEFLSLGRTYNSICFLFVGLLLIVAVESQHLVYRILKDSLSIPLPLLLVFLK